MNKDSKRWGQDWEEEDLGPSKTAVKKQMTALQDLGKRIVELSAGELSTIPLEGDLQEAILTARRIKSREGLRRQLQYIGKLMRQTDTEAIEQAFTRLEDGRKDRARHFQQLEQWRDQLLEQGLEATEAVVAKYPNADRQHLRQLILQTEREKKANKPPASARKLFRYLRELDDLSQ